MNFSPLTTIEVEVCETQEVYIDFLSALLGIRCKEGMTEEEISVAKDIINHPDHYETGKYECIDVMIESQGTAAVKDFCICNVFKYLYRHRRKNGVEDIKKAKWYLNKALELEESEHEME